MDSASDLSDSGCTNKECDMGRSGKRHVYQSDIECGLFRSGVIRVGDKYYMVNSDFHYMGMPVLESDDMINWKIISQVYRRLDFPDWDTNGNYGGGSWPPLSVIMTGSSGFTSVLPVKGW